MSQDTTEVAVVPEVVQNPAELIQVKQLPIIMERLAELKKFWENELANAVALEATEENLQYIRTLRAMNNNYFKECEEQRKFVKKAIMAPYLNFESVYDDCVANLHDRGDDILRDKENAIVGAMKDPCEQKLRVYFNELTQVNGLGFLRYEQAGIVVSMADVRAKTQPPKKLREQLERFVSRVGQDVDMILRLDGADEILVEYKQTLNATQAISFVKERRRNIELARAEQERRNALKAQEAEARQKMEAFAPPTVEVSPEVAEDQLTVTFSVTDTRDRLKLLKQFLDASGYKYE